MNLINKTFLIRRLSAAARLLMACDRHQLDADMQRHLDLRAISTHLESLATLTADRPLGEVNSAHRSFAVIPHAQWMGQRPKPAREKQSFRLAGRVGGRSRSLKKRAASVANGRKGGRPKFDHRKLEIALRKTICGWFESPDNDRHLTLEAKKLIVKRLWELPLTDQRFIISILKG